MRFHFDLLPPEYKSLPRDVVGIVLAVAAIVLCVSWISSMSVSNAYQLKKAQDEIDKAENELRDLNKRIGDLQPPLAVINSLKARIDFLNANLDTPASSWVDFLFTLESTVPERVSVKDFNPKDFSAQGGQFTLEGEAITINDVLEFIGRLQSSGRFGQDVHLVQTANKILEDRVVVAFTLSLTYKGRQ
ncbi:MAG: hypothetical protein OZSIB_2475 [Candidatus Ozemobacter sibiricus]|uniref:Type IV pilus biogenesis protein PilN n=1 Tax=Candidatus Ozemobacter sibiricus TaxID=2268124 RepID=A0A367ZSJ4_9BACT|nr:MAG: hypothetical protein OZSIB_2475 [Candidatus Ozemobacter sibiricus]